MSMHQLLGAFQHPEGPGDRLQWEQRGSLGGTGLWPLRVPCAGKRIWPHTQGWGTTPKQPAHRRHLINADTLLGG